MNIGMNDLVKLGDWYSAPTQRTRGHRRLKAVRMDEYGLKTLIEPIAGSRN
jgi:hypothetical protein